MGAGFSTLRWLATDDLPPPGEVEYCTLEAEDHHGREITVMLGRGGIVTDKRLSPGIWRIRWTKIQDELRNKPYSKLLAKYRWIVLSLATAIMVTVGLILRHQRMSR